MFGRKRLKELLINNYEEDLSRQKEIILTELKYYQRDRRRNDDITFLAMKLGN